MVGSLANDFFQTGGASSSDALGAAVAFALMGSCGLAYAVTRSLAVRRTFATSKHKVEADRDALRFVARRRLRNAIAFTLVAIAIGVAIAALPAAAETRAVLEVTPALACLVGAVNAFLLGRLVQRAANSEVQVLSHGQFLFAARGGRLIGWTSAPPRVMARATGLPVARVLDPRRCT